MFSFNLFLLRQGRPPRTALESIARNNEFCRRLGIDIDFSRDPEAFKEAIKVHFIFHFSLLQIAQHFAAFTVHPKIVCKMLNNSYVTLHLDT